MARNVEGEALWRGGGGREGGRGGGLGIEEWKERWNGDRGKEKNEGRIGEKERKRNGEDLSENKENKT